MLGRFFDRSIVSLPSFWETPATTSSIPAVDAFTRGDDRVVGAGDGTYRLESQYGSFERSIRCEGVKEADISAH